MTNISRLNRIVLMSVLVVVAHSLVADDLHGQAPNWYVQHDLAPNVIKDMDSRDSLRCLAAVDSTLFVISRVIKTTDGGVTWRTVLRRYNPDGYIGRVTSVSWASDSLAIATADSGRLLRSTDGGETWDDRAVFDTNSTPYVRMIDSLHGFVYLDYVPEPRCFTTDDAGLTWQAFDVPDPVGYDVRWWVWSRTPPPVRISPGRFVCVREGRGNFTESRLLVTSDRGKTWDTVRTAFPGYEAYGPWAFGMRFADSLVGYASLMRDGKWLVSRTTDGGFTWSIVSAEPVTGVQAQTPPYIMWAGDSLRVMVGSFVTVRRSTDGGTTWTIDSSDVAWNEHPNFAPPHPTDAWPVFGFNQFNRNKILHYGIPPPTTGVEPLRDDRRRLPRDEGIDVLDLRVDASFLHIRFVSIAHGPVSVRLFDLNGALRYRRDLEGVVPGERSLDIETRRLPAGLYVLRIVGDVDAVGRLLPIPNP